MSGTVAVGSPFVIPELPLLLLGFLFIVAFIGGLVTASMGPGGIILISAMSVLTPLSPAQIAGTSASIFVVGTLLGSVSYANSGDIEYALAVPLALASVVGVRAGVWLNAYVSEEAFGLILACVVLVVGGQMLYREYHELPPVVHLDWTTSAGLGAVAAVGLAIGGVGGLTGIGGAALSVPVLVLLGVPIVRAVAAGMVQSLCITATTATSYALTGETVWALTLAFMIPFAVGIVAGWRVAHRADARVLKLTLGCLLVLLAGGIVFI